MSTLYIHIERNILLFQIIRSTVMYVIRWELFRFHILIYNKPTQYIYTHMICTHGVYYFLVHMTWLSVIMLYHWSCSYKTSGITPSILPLKNKLWFFTTTLIRCKIPAFQGILERASPNRKLNKRRMKIKPSYVVIMKMFLYLLRTRNTSCIKCFANF